MLWTSRLIISDQAQLAPKQAGTRKDYPKDSGLGSRSSTSRIRSNSNDHDINAVRSHFVATTITTTYQPPILQQGELILWLAERSPRSSSWGPSVWAYSPYDRPLYSASPDHISLIPIFTQITWRAAMLSRGRDSHIHSAH